MTATNLTQNLTKKLASRPSLSRRGFLGGLASGAAALALGACSGGSGGRTLTHLVAASAHLCAR